MSATNKNVFFVLRTSNSVNYAISVVNQGSIATTLNIAVNLTSNFGKMVLKADKIVVLVENTLFVLTYNGTNFTSSFNKTVTAGSSNDSIDIHDSGLIYLYASLTEISIMAFSNHS